MVEEEWLEEVANQEERVKISPMLEHFVRGLLLMAEDIIAVGSAVDPNSPILLRNCRIGGQATAAYFMAAMAEGDPITAPIAEQEAALIKFPRPPYEHAEPSSWKKGFNLAAIAGDLGALTRLARVPPGLLRQSGHGIDEYLHCWAAALAASITGVGDVAALASATREATQPQRLRVSKPALAKITAHLAAGLEAMHRDDGE